MLADPYRDSILIEADLESVFEYFTRPEALVRWMGDRAILDPRPGGEFTLYFGDRCVEGQYVEVARPRKIVISWGRRGSKEFPPSSSRLEVSLAEEGTGTRVSIVHHGLPRREAPRHALGWQYYLRRLQIVGEGKRPEPHTTPKSLTDGAD